MKPLLYKRKGKVIFSAENDEVINDFRCVNEAKRESRKLQISTDGKLGLGSVQVIEESLSVKRKRFDSREIIRHKKHKIRPRKNQNLNESIVY